MVGELAEEIQTIAIPMMERANVLATEDSDAFDRVMEGFGLPKPPTRRRIFVARPSAMQPSLRPKCRLKRPHWPWNCSQDCPTWLALETPMP